jgi:hypothetical protein
MSIYYYAKIFYEDPKEGPHYLGERTKPRGEPIVRYGVCHIDGAKRFLWKEEAHDALCQFMAQCEHPRIKHGQVFHVEEQPVGPVVNTGVALPAPSEPVSEPEQPIVDQRAYKVDIEQGAALVDAYESMDHTDRTKRVMEARHAASDWFFENADAIFEALRYHREHLLRGSSQPVGSGHRPAPESPRSQDSCPA